MVGEKKEGVQEGQIPEEVLRLLLLTSFNITTHYMSLTASLVGKVQV